MTYILNKQAKEIEKMKKQISKLDKKNTENQKAILAKADHGEMEVLKELVKILPKEEDVHQQHKLVADKLDFFKKENDNFHNEFKIQNEIIRRFDEVLS